MTHGSATRHNQSLVSGAERRVLISIARRLPQWVSPDGLTWLGVAGACIVLLGYALSRNSFAWLWLANGGLLIHWFGDSLDGTLARVRGIERPRYGFYFDQVVDTLSNLLIALGVGLCPAVRMDLALGLLAIFQMLSIQVCVRAIVDREFHMAVGRLGPTEMRIGIVFLNVGILLFGTRPIPGLPHWLHWEDGLMIATGAGLLLLFGMQMRDQMRRLAQEEPARAPSLGKADLTTGSITE